MQVELEERNITNSSETNVHFFQKKNISSSNEIDGIRHINITKTVHTKHVDTQLVSSTNY